MLKVISCLLLFVSLSAANDDDKDFMPKVPPKPQLWASSSDEVDPHPPQVPHCSSTKKCCVANYEKMKTIEDPTAPWLDPVRSINVQPYDAVPNSVTYGCTYMMAGNKRPRTAEHWRLTCPKGKRMRIYRTQEDQKRKTSRNDWAVCETKGHFSKEHQLAWHWFKDTDKNPFAIKHHTIPKDFEMDGFSKYDRVYVNLDYPQSSTPRQHW